MVAKNSQEVNPKDVKGLPKGALIANNRYVYFSYSYRENGRVKTDKDYIGVVENMEFVPNYYYQLVHPEKDNRPLENWKTDELRRKAESRRKKAEQKAAAAAAQAEAQSPSPEIVNQPNPPAAEQVSAQPPETGPQLQSSASPTAQVTLPVQQKPVSAPAVLCKESSCELAPDAYKLAGDTALLAAMAYESHLVEDVSNVLYGNVEHTINVLNLGMYGAITEQPTYLAARENSIRKFFGQGCLDSPRASEFHIMLGQMEGSLSARFGRARCSRIKPHEVLALDGTRIRSNSENIPLAVVGKDKSGGFSKQINFSMLVNATTGEPLAYRLYAGNIHDVKAIDDFRCIWRELELADKAVVVACDRGYCSQADLIAMNEDKLLWLVGAKLSLKEIRDIIDNENDRFYAAINIIPYELCYGLQRPIVLKTTGGKTCQANAYVYRNPEVTMKEAVKFREELERFADDWLKGKVSPNDKRMVFFKKPRPGKALQLDENEFENFCYSLGFFALVSNCDYSAAEALSRYGMRNEVEVGFKNLLNSTMRTTRVHSLPALLGRTFTSVISLNLRMDLLHRLRRPDENGRELRGSWTSREVLRTLHKIGLVHDGRGGCRLLNVTDEDRKLVMNLGFKGLLDDGNRVYELLSRHHMEQYLRGL